MSQQLQNVQDLNGGRKAIVEGEYVRIATPMAHSQRALDNTAKRVLWRFIWASELALGNRAVVIDSDGEPRGRYREYSERVDVETYIKSELAAYRWILEHALGKQAAQAARIIARLEGERLETIDFEKWGAHITNCDHELVALGGAIGSVVMLAMMLADAYRDWADLCRIRESAAHHGRALDASAEAALMQRRRSAMRAALTHGTTRR